MALATIESTELKANPMHITPCSTTHKELTKGPAGAHCTSFLDGDFPKQPISAVRVLILWTATTPIRGGVMYNDSAFKYPCTKPRMRPKCDWVRDALFARVIAFGPQWRRAMARRETTRRRTAVPPCGRVIESMLVALRSVQELTGHQQQQYYIGYYSPITVAFRVAHNALRVGVVPLLEACPSRVMKSLH